MALLSQDEALLSLLLPQGVASLRSLALGWELIAPSGRTLNASCPRTKQNGARVERLLPTDETKTGLR